MYGRPVAERRPGAPPASRARQQALALAPWNSQKTKVRGSRSGTLGPRSVHSYFSESTSPRSCHVLAASAKYLPPPCRTSPGEARLVLRREAALLRELGNRRGEHPHLRLIGRAVDVAVD